MVCLFEILPGILVSIPTHVSSKGKCPCIPFRNPMVIGELVRGGICGEIHTLDVMKILNFENQFRLQE